jgi:hypothetical protein
LLDISQWYLWPAYRQFIENNTLSAIIEVKENIVTERLKISVLWAEHF